VRKIEDVFRLWPTLVEMANAVDMPYDRVRMWKNARRIPWHAWDEVIGAAAKRGILITHQQLSALNAPTRRMGRPTARSHAARRGAARRLAR
jgi:hypothetical protein